MPESSAALSQLRLLILSPKPQASTEPSSFPAVLQALTGELPSADLTTFAGYTSHLPLVLSTKYYSRQVSLWCDELPSSTTTEGSVDGQRTAVDVTDAQSATETSDETLSLQQWQETMLSPEAGEVRAVMGGIILLLPVSASQSSAQSLLASFMPYLKAAHALRETIEDESLGRDVASIVILQQKTYTNGNSSASRSDATLKELVEALESSMIENDMFGWDVACCTDPAVSQTPDDLVDGGVRNEFGEKLGMARVIEVLEGIDWAAPAGDEEEKGAENEYGILDDERFKGLDHELQQEMLGLKLSMLDGDNAADDSEGEDLSLEQMDDLKSRVLAIRDTVAGMPQAQREAFAKREIDRIMRDF
jgi:hypothetical protein